MLSIRFADRNDVPLVECQKKGVMRLEKGATGV